MRFRNRSGELFFLLLACLAQVVTVLACTLWREVVFVPERWKGPPLTQEYLVWYLDEYVPPIDYEGQLFSLYFPLLPAGAPAGGGACVAVLPVLSEGPRTEEGLLPLVAASWGSWDSPSGCGIGQPYYLWMDVVPLCVLSWQVLLLWGIPWVSARPGSGPCLPLQT